jgi:DNA-nicking Smr family endonuclease
MKDRSDKRSPGDFKNNPFKPLKGFTPKPAPAGKKTLPPPAHDPDGEDEASLFLRAAAGAKQLDERAESSSPKARTRGAARADDADEQRLFLEAMSTIGSVMQEQPSEEMDTEQRRLSPSSRMRQLKRGTIRISGELDLHGYVRLEALVRLEQFIASAFGRGSKAVLVITGKGINSPEGPVLREAVAGWLREKGRRTGMVAEFAPAPRDKGGSGAFVVFLKNE